MAMKVAAILLLSIIFVQANPVEKREAAPFDPFAMMVQKYISKNDFNALCDLNRMLQTILTESKNEEDQKIIEKNLEKLKEATHHLENFHCQVPIITSLVTEPPTEIADTTLKNEEVTETVTNQTQIEDSTDQGSLCDDCEVDYKVEDENREEFAEVLDEVSVEDTASYQPKVIALFSVIGICGIALLGLLVFTVVKMISSVF